MAKSSMKRPNLDNLDNADEHNKKQNFSKNDNNPAPETQGKQKKGPNKYF